MSEKLFHQDAPQCVLDLEAIAVLFAEVLRHLVSSEDTKFLRTGYRERFKEITGMEVPE